MTDAERQLLLDLAREVQRLFAERNDMIIGITAVILDLYRVQFAAHADTRDAALSRLRLQRDAINEQVHDGSMSRYLEFVIQSLEAGALDAAKLQREPVVGSA